MHDKRNMREWRQEMYASELIRQLTELTVQHGDLQVTDEYGNELGAPEFNNDTDPAVLLVCFESGD